MIVFAPWTKEQVDGLNRYQKSDLFHPFTCGGEHGGDKVLVATEQGWVCGRCAYTQNWAHDFMIRPRADACKLTMTNCVEFFRGNRRNMKPRDK